MCGADSLMMIGSKKNVETTFEKGINKCRHSFVSKVKSKLEVA